jgi:hypothetical protein
VSCSDDLPRSVLVVVVLERSCVCTYSSQSYIARSASSCWVLSCSAAAAVAAAAAAVALYLSVVAAAAVVGLCCLLAAGILCLAVAVAV